MSRLLDAAAGVPNASEPVPGLVTGGQPAPAHLAALKAAGCQAVIDMRDPMEPRPYRVPDAVLATGLAYVSIPVPHDPGDDETLAAVRRAVVGQLAKGPVFAHCASGNRTGAALIPYLMLDKKMTEEDAVDEAMRMGTRSAALIEWAVGYVRNQAG
jgi:protein tyrosine phosphatase (PTP) superfamily phosphohydrolase (DUF442 family)